MSIQKFIKTRIVGTQHHPGGQTRLNTMRHKDAVVLEREPQNKYDPNAVAVYSADRVMLGYIPARDVPIIAACLDADRTVWASIDMRQPHLHILFSLPGNDPTKAPTSPVDDW